MEHKALKKLKSQGGETIAELLVALLIAALALTMLASMISSSSKVILRSMDSMEKYVAAENQISAHEKKSGDDNVRILEGDFTVTLHVNGSGDAWALTDDRLEEPLKVTYYVADAIKGKPVVSYAVK